MNQLSQICPITDAEAERLVHPATLADLAARITAEPIPAASYQPARPRTAAWPRARRRWPTGTPLAATLALRAMIAFTLTKARSSRYRHAARHFMECESLAAAIKVFGAFETHTAYAARLKGQHARKSGFWSLIS